MKRKRSKKSSRESSSDDEDYEAESVTLVNKNHILFYSSVHPKAFSRLRKILLLLETKKTEQVFLHVKSYGGCAHTGLACYDVLRAFPVPLVSIVEGYCMSAATLLALAADTRFMMPNAVIMIHQISSGFAGTFREQEVDFDNTSKIMNKYTRIYHRRTHMTQAQVKKELQSDAEMDLPIAKERGFVDGPWPRL